MEEIMSWQQFVQLLFFAISLGSMYALIAIGYTIVYGLLGLINIAHGDFFMLAGFLAMWGVFRYNLPWPISFALAALIVPVWGMIVERLAYRPLRDYKISAFTSTVAVSFFLQSFVVIFFTARAKAFPRPAFVEKVIHYQGIEIPMVTVVIIVTSIILFILLTLIVTRTKIGRSMRALSKDVEATKLMGVNTDQVISFAFALATLYAAAAAILWGFKFPTFDPYTGIIPGLKGFIGAVIGGIGSIPGALMGGFVLGFAEIMIVGFLPDLSGWRDIIAYSIMILFLLFRPGGIFNVKVREEKV
jgi:branched-chain amino acid transport system permease protein